MLMTSKYIIQQEQKQILLQSWLPALEMYSAHSVIASLIPVKKNQSEN